MWPVWSIYIIQARSCAAADPRPPGAHTPGAETNVALLRATAAKYEIFPSILAGSIGQITQLQRPLLATSKSCLASPWRTYWPVYVCYFLPFCTIFMCLFIIWLSPNWLQNVWMGFVCLKDLNEMYRNVILMYVIVLLLLSFGWG